MTPKPIAIIYAVVLTAVPWSLAWGQAPQATSWATPPAPAPSQSADDPMVAMIRAKLTRDPNHSDSWRILGKLESKRGNAGAAREAFMRALQIDPENAAAHFDLGEWLLSSGNRTESATHFNRCCEMAPQSSYAQQLYERGWVSPPHDAAAPPDDNSVAFASGQPDATATNSAGNIRVDPVGYEIQTFDGKDDFDRRFNQLSSDADPALKRLRVFLETGVLYNSNVSLTPISRGLAPSNDESFQAVFNPELEWMAIRQDKWRAGPLGRGYLTLNESQQSEFDLAGYQLGGFAERDFSVGSSEWVGRLDYVFAVDQLGGDRLADRHSVTASMIMIGADLDVTYLYLTTAVSDFEDDGLTPEIDSLDGTGLTTGITRYFQTGKTWAPNYSVGIDAQWADTDGADVRYRSLTSHAEMTFKPAEKISFITGGGLGYRDFYDFTGPVNRDELTWRISGKLRWHWTDRTAISLVADYDRFASDNENFDSERIEGGVVMSINY